MPFPTYIDAFKERGLKRKLGEIFTQLQATSANEIIDEVESVKSEILRSNDFKTLESAALEATEKGKEYKGG